MNSIMIYLPIVMAIIGSVYVDETFVGIKTRCWDGKMKEISDYIYEGALAFLKQNIDC
jgi:K(+)-stimulated pyrophosphate-energized sodium pump